MNISEILKMNPKSECIIHIDGEEQWRNSNYQNKGWYDKKIDTNIVVSKSAEKYIKKYFPNKYHTIPNGIEIKYYKKSNQNINEVSNNLKLIFIVRNDKRKGLKYLIDCLQK